MVLFMILVVNHLLIMCGIFEWQRMSAGLFVSLFICVLPSREEGLAGLTPSHFCSFPKPGPGFPMSYVVVFLCVQLLVKVSGDFVRFTDIGGIVYHHC